MLTGEAAEIELLREQQRVLELSATGALSSEVATILGLSPDEVRVHIALAVFALGARSKLEAVVIALRRGLIRLPDDYRTAAS